MRELIPYDQVKALLAPESAEVFEKLDRNLPQLSERQIDQIAERCADVVVHRLAEDAAKERTWRKRLKKLAAELSVNLLASGIWAALAYAAAHVLFFGQEELTPEQERMLADKRQVRRLLEKGLTAEELENLPLVTSRFSSRATDTYVLKDRLLGMAEFHEFGEVIADLQRRGGSGSDKQEEFFAHVFSTTILVELNRVTEEQLLSQGNLS